MRPYSIVTIAVALFPLLSLIGGMSLPDAYAAQHPAAIVQVQTPTNDTWQHVPVTFAQVFSRGDVPGDRPLEALPVAGRAVQIDVKRHYDDGSVRLAIVSALYDQLPGGSSQPLVLAPTASTRNAAASATVELADLLKTDFDAVATFEFPDGAVRTASVRKVLGQAGGNARVWLRGPVATEWLLGGPPLDAQNNPDDDLMVQWQVRAYAGCRQVRVSMAVENCGDRWAGNIRYDVRLTVGGHEVFASQAVDHRRLSRWRKVFWWGQRERPVQVVHDLATLTACGALPNYDRTLTPAELSKETRGYLDLDGPNFGILGRGSLVAYMGTTGGRMEIAPYPTWTMQYLLSMTPESKAVVLTHADLGGSWPIHVRARGTGRIMPIDSRPQFWLDGRGKDRPEWKPDRHAPDARQVKLDPDLAHQPSLAYVPYLVTGDYYYLEEAYFWANYCLLATWPEPRQDARGILAGQIRGDAWGLRNIADAAWIGCDDDPEVAYFDEKIRNNIDDRIARMYGPPEYNRIGAWGVRTVPDARIPNAANPDWMVTAPWEEDYLLWSLHHLVELGYADAARPRDFLLRLRVGMLTHAPDFDPMLATPYRLVVGQRTGGKDILFYEDWKKLGAENARLSKPDLPNYGNSYAYSARAAVICGIDGGFPNSREALDWLDANLPNHRQVMAANPVWAIVPRSAR